MYYVRKEFDDDTRIDLSLDEKHEFYAICNKCLDEIEISNEEMAKILADDGLRNGLIFCKHCAKEIKMCE